MQQRERRFKLSINHTIAKHILDTYPNSLIGLEDLTGIRERTKRRKRRRKGKQLVPVSPKAREANRHASRWAFAELRGRLAYKAALTGSGCIAVDADYTSQCCPRCGYTSRRNRPQHGLALCLPALPLYPPQRPDRCQEYLLANACHPAGLDGNGAVVRCPRCDRPRSQNCAPFQVRGTAVESGHKPPALAGGA